MDRFERILVSLYEAVFDDERWPVTSRLIDEACGSKGNTLVFGDGGLRNDVDIFFARFCYRGQRREDLERLYFGTYHAVDERMPRVRRLPNGQIVHVDSLYNDEEKRTSVVYNEALPLGRTQDSLNVRLDGPQGSRLVLVAADPVDDEGWSSERVKTIVRLLPHLRQYVQVRQALIDARAVGSGAAALLENSRFGVIQLNRRGVVLSANGVALDILRNGDALKESNGFLRAAVSEDDEALQRVLAGARPLYGAPGRGGSVTLRRTLCSPRLVLHIHPLGGGRVDPVSSQVAVLVLVTDPLDRYRIDPALVREVFGFTPAQCQVAVLLAQGRSIREIAQETGRTEGTIRWHTKQIYQDYGISGQSELVRLVSSLNDISRGFQGKAT